jgi:NAD(P)-dependent dehydrogenase (short-subunit alcohol dehydrogenase family)
VKGAIRLSQNFSGKTAVITGANSGIGLEAAKVLAGKGIHIIMAVRNEAKGVVARKEILALHPAATVEIRMLDVADLASVRTFADEILRDFAALDLLINNAGVMMPPYSKTKDGFEMQFGSNHLGHFALTALLFPLIDRTPDSRIVTTGSLAHNRGSIDFENLDGSKGYKAKKFYNQSKLANMLFALELDRLLKKHGSGTISVICHPGVSARALSSSNVPHCAANWNVPKRRWLDATRVSTAPGRKDSRTTGMPVVATARLRLVGMPSPCMASLMIYSRSIGPSAARPSPPLEYAVFPEPFN